MKTINDWKTVKLGEVCEIISGSTPRTGVEEFWGGKILWATPKDLSKLDSMYLEDTTQKITEAGFKSCSTQMLPVGSVLFSSRAPIGHVAINTKPLCTNQGFKSLIPKSDIDAKFLYFWLRANRDFLDSLGNGATFKEVSKAIVERVEIPLPPLAEQQRLANILDAADALRKQRRQSLAQLDELAQSLFLELFGDPATNPKEWEMVKLPEICSPKQWPTLSMNELSGNGYPVYGANGVIGHHHTFNHEVETVLITCRGATCGTVNVCPPLSYVTGNAMALDDPDKSKVNIRYLEWFLRQRNMNDVISGSAQPQITRQGLQNLQIPLPPLSLQQEFAAQMAELETIKTRSRQSLVELDALFASLQERAFAGEL